MGTTAPRWRDLPAADRRVVAIVTGLVLVFVPAGVAHALRFAWVPTSEDAQIAVRAADVFSTKSPLLGMPTSPLNADGVIANHPGPLLFWLFAPGVRLLGAAAGLVVTATLVNAASVVGIAWISARVAGRVVACTLVLGAGAVLGAMGGSYATFRPLNLVVVVLPLLLLAVLVWAVLLGQGQLLPLALLVGSAVVQSHLGFGPMVVALLAVAGGAWLRQTKATDGATRPPSPRWLRVHLAVLFAALAVLGGTLVVETGAHALVGVVVGAGLLLLPLLARAVVDPARRTVARRGLLVLAVCWTLPLVDALVNDGGNLADLVQGSRDDPSPMFGWSLVEASARAILGPVPVFVGRLDAGTMAASLAPASLLVLLLVAVLWFRAVRRGDQVMSNLFLVAVVTGTAASLGAGRALLGFTSPGHLLWLHVAAVLLWASVVVGVVREPAITRRGGGRAVSAVCVGLAVFVGFWIAVPDVVRPGTEQAWEYGRWLHRAVPEINGEVVEGVEPEDGPVLVYGWGSIDARFAAEAAMVPLERAGVATLSEEPDRWGEDRAFLDHRDQAHAVLTVAPAGVANPPPGEVVARWEPSEEQRRTAEALVAEVADVARAGPLVLNPAGEEQIRHRLDAYVAEQCTLPAHVASGCNLPEVVAGPVDPELLAELPDSAVARLYADGLVASPTLEPELVQALRFDLAEPLEVYLARASR